MAGSARGMVRVPSLMRIRTWKWRTEVALTSLTRHGKGTYILAGGTAYDRDYQNGKGHRTGLEVTSS